MEAVSRGAELYDSVKERNVSNNLLKLFIAQKIGFVIVSDQLCIGGFCKRERSCSVLMNWNIACLSYHFEIVCTLLL